MFSLPAPFSSVVLPCHCPSEPQDQWFQHGWKTSHQQHDSFASRSLVLTLPSLPLKKNLRSFFMFTNTYTVSCASLLKACSVIPGLCPCVSHKYFALCRTAACYHYLHKITVIPCKDNQSKRT